MTSVDHLVYHLNAACLDRLETEQRLSSLRRLAAAPLQEPLNIPGIVLHLHAGPAMATPVAALSTRV